MNPIAENLDQIKKNIPGEVCLVAVSKTKPNEAIQEAYDAGQRVFGENKVQEMVAKAEELPNDIEWHMIGHLQRNKVKYMAGFVHLIHGIDSLKLLQEINKQAAKHQRVQSVLLQVHIAEEETKFGFSADEIKEIIQTEAISNYPNVHLKGLMGMATFTHDQVQLRREFESLKALYDWLKNSCPSVDILSMGMSGDYPLAIDCGSNMIRVGTAIFGSR